MSAVTISQDAIAEQVNSFAAAIEDAEARWRYCYSKATYQDAYKGRIFTALNEKALPACDRVIGVYPGFSKFRIEAIKRYGFEEAKRRHDERATAVGDFYRVGPLQAWNIGHVYFARLVAAPHIVKIGFSRRVAERLADIESSIKEKVFVRPRELLVGTHIDEKFWHQDWRKLRIHGEWFFDPFMTERAIPDFLAQYAEAA